jgi:hypothetical protein
MMCRTLSALKSEQCIACEYFPSARNLWISLEVLRVGWECDASQLWSSLGLTLLIGDKCDNYVHS